MLIVYRNALFSYISRLKSRRNLPPEKEKNGIRLAAREVRCRVGFIDACRASFALSKHCLCHYNGAWLAFVSITLSKHCFCISKSSSPACPSLCASIADVMTLPASFELSFILSKHRIWLSTLSLAVDCSWQASRLDAHPLRCEGKYPQTPLVFHSSLTSKGEQQ